MLTSAMDHKLNRQAPEYASMAVAGARQKHVINISCPDGGTSLDRNNLSGFMVSSRTEMAYSVLYVNIKHISCTS